MRKQREDHGKSSLIDHHVTCKRTKFCSRVAGWIENQESALCWPRDAHAGFMDARRPSAERQKKVFQANGTEKRAGVATLREKKF